MPSFDQLTIDTPRLHLRPLCLDDAAAILRIRSNPDVMRYMTTAPWTDISQAIAMIERDQAAILKGDIVRLGMIRKSDNVLIGSCILFHLDAGCRRAEIGYDMDAAVWGQGYMQEALVALLNYGFNEMNLNRVEADIEPNNLGSAKTLERLGFIREGYFRERWIIEGVVSDSAIYGLLRSDWLARVPPLRSPV
ncbi:GNAT family N-acetyltransferase [Undibacterium umbellatum]|uniref:GNAT family N-acetyltransferase n=1 Tax=Undibacterium umbellatum TaxID=2762300 RepID=A0ABR6ZDE4_9BURK|nr:GNAT family protein [Undibacterium umbellatum]MBC3909743.1 GNAT family N-acetyltransferase [Undibacterium umbellatum]